MNRRDFLKGMVATIGGAGVIGAGLVNGNGNAPTVAAEELGAQEALAPYTGTETNVGNPGHTYDSTYPKYVGRYGYMGSALPYKGSVDFRRPYMGT